MTENDSRSILRLEQLKARGLVATLEQIDPATIKVIKIAHLDSPSPVEYWAYADPTAEGKIDTMCVSGDLQVIPRKGLVVHDWTGSIKTTAHIRETFPACIVQEGWVGVDE